MWGFSITVTSNVGFSNSYSRGQEGSSWLLKKFLSPFAPKGAEMFTPDLLSAIDAQFEDLVDVLIKLVGGIETNFYVNLTGDFMATIKFEAETPANIQVWRFLHNIGLNNQEMGVHVMKALCENILDFSDYIFLKYYNNPPTIPILNVEINL